MAVLLLEESDDRPRPIPRARSVHPAHEAEEHAALPARRGTHHPPRRRVLRLRGSSGGCPRNRKAATLRRGIVLVSLRGIVVIVALSFACAPHLERTRRVIVPLDRDGGTCYQACMKSSACSPGLPCTVG